MRKGLTLKIGFSRTKPVLVNKNRTAIGYIAVPVEQYDS
jgi:hypothetical protein